MTGSTKRRTCSRVIFLGAWLAATLSFGKVPEAPRPHVLEDATEAEARKYGDTFAWQNDGPLDLLDLLRRRAEGASGPDSFFYTVHGTHVGWLRETDVPGLIKLLDTKDPCAHVVRTLSSYLPMTRSFVGQEALFLIEGYRRGRYPPHLHSTDFYERKREILQWWDKKEAGRGRNRQKGSEEPANKGMQQTVGAMVTSGAPPAADAQRWADNGR